MLIEPIVRVLEVCVEITECRIGDVNMFEEQVGIFVTDGERVRDGAVAHGGGERGYFIVGRSGKGEYRFADKDVFIILQFQEDGISTVPPRCGRFEKVGDFGEETCILLLLLLGL